MNKRTALYGILFIIFALVLFKPLTLGLFWLLSLIFQTMPDSFMNYYIPIALVSACLGGIIGTFAFVRLLRLIVDDLLEEKSAEKN